MLSHGSVFTSSQQEWVPFSSSSKMGGVIFECLQVVASSDQLNFFTSHSPKFHQYWSLTIILLRVIYRIFFERVLLLCRDADTISRSWTLNVTEWVPLQLPWCVEECYVPQSFYLSIYLCCAIYGSDIWIKIKRVSRMGPNLLLALKLASALLQRPPASAWPPSVGVGWVATFTPLSSLYSIGSCCPV